ncbi:DUF3667 domain-containing protein [Hellea balneolensis]|uniref:DUF3667 domain-containing protein n=1 Tax=Hellea balneolensis TaxID=287478 RepID=UPI00040F150C|nr:DUF3667 domain-containing protein [Hellea balneolensis]
MGDTDTIDLEQAGLLDADTIPNANQSLNCFSCGETMSGVYCYACGNKNDDYRRSIWSLGAELFSSLTAFEGRIWRSLRSLIFKPGQMSREFSDGARQKWTSPIRLYLATSLLLFGYVALSGTQLVAFGPKMLNDSPVKAEFGDAKLVPQVFFLERKSTISEAISEDAIAAFENDVVSMINNDEDMSLEELQEELVRVQKSADALKSQIEKATNKYAKSGMQRGLTPMQNRIKSLKNRIENYSEDTDETGINGKNSDKTAGSSPSNIQLTDATGRQMTLDAEGIREAFTIGLRQPERINAPISKYLPRIMFVMMPFSMLLGAIFIRGRKRAMLYDHLVHAAYIHAFSFLLLFFFILLVQLTPIKGLIYIYSLILLIYLPLSAKRMFGRGWFKTFLTSYGVGLIYTFIMMLILFFLMSMGVSDILKDVSIKT